jgi:hypothetical protein
MFPHGAKTGQCCGHRPVVTAVTKIPSVILRVRQVFTLILILTTVIASL